MVHAGPSCVSSALDIHSTSARVTVAVKSGSSKHNRHTMARSAFCTSHHITAHAETHTKAQPVAALAGWG
jgi:hypothetical protein